MEKRKKLSEIITPEDRQAFLQYLLDKEIEKVRKIIYPYQRRNLIDDNITIKESDLTEINAGGLYEYDEKNGVHKISINTATINYYLNYKKCWWLTKTRCKKNLINTIGHELVHALVSEKFEHVYRDISNKNKDASPVFLATLQFLGYTSNHRCAYKYKYSHLYYEIEELLGTGASWIDYKLHIFQYLKKIDDVKSKYTDRYNKINFAFSSRSDKLEKHYNLVSEATLLNRDNNKLEKLFKVSNISFDIGSTLDVNRLEELVLKKIKNGSKAKYDSISKKYMVGSKENKTGRILKSVDIEDYDKIA